MRRARRIVVLLFASFTVAACATPDPGSSAPPVSAWRVEAARIESDGPRAVALLSGSALTSKALYPYRAVLEIACYRNAPRVRIGFQFTVTSGSVRLAYRFDALPERQILVRGRGHRRNILVIEQPADVTPFLAALSSATTLQIDIRRPPFRYDRASFEVSGAAAAIDQALAPCRTVETKPKGPAGLPALTATAKDDADDSLVKSIGPVSDGDN